MQDVAADEPALDPRAHALWLGNFVRGRNLAKSVAIKRRIGAGPQGETHLVQLIGRRRSANNLATTPSPSPGARSSVYAMRTVTKASAVRLRLARQLNEERQILMRVMHPCVQTLLATGQDDAHVYLLFEFAHGGELFSHLRSCGRFDNDRACVYAAQVTMALEHLHEACGPIVHRDVRPETILLDRLGFVMLSSFTFAKRLHFDHSRTWTLCGTPEYLAPERIQQTGHGCAVDWWAASASDRP